MNAYNRGRDGSASGRMPLAKNLLLSPSSQSPGQESLEQVRLRLFRSPSQRTLVLCLLLFAATLTLYRPVVKNDFVNFDDDFYILNNGHVRAGLTWEVVKWSFGTLEQGNWHPLTWMSHALDCQLFGVSPAGHHLTNVLLHGGSVVVLFLLLQSATGFAWRSLMVAALFALHPVNVESVAWAAERKNVLSMFLCLLALYAYEWYARRPELGRYGTVLLLYLLALMAKPQVITFPLLLLLWDYWPLGRVEGLGAKGPADSVSAAPRVSVVRLVGEKLPLLLLSAGDAVVTVIAQHSGHAMRTWTEYSLLNRIENALLAYVRYLGMAFWPSGLAVFYPHATRFPVGRVVGAALVLAIVTMYVFSRRRQEPYLIVGWLWFLGSMFPMIGIVQVGGQALADRYAYLPFIGLFLMVVWVAANWPVRPRIAPAGMAVAAAVTLIALSVVSYRQIHHWRDTTTLWERALAVTNENLVAHDNLAIFLAQHGHEEEAIPHLLAVLAIDPSDPLARLNLAIYEQERGRLAEAIEGYKAVLARAPDPDMRANALGNLGSAYRQMGDHEDARRCYEESLRLVPGRPLGMVGLGLIALQEGDFARAAREFSQAMAVQPTDVGYLLLARALDQGGHPAEAQAALERASQISSNLKAAEREADALIASK